MRAQMNRSYHLRAAAVIAQALEGLAPTMQKSEAVNAAGVLAYRTRLYFYVWDKDRQRFESSGSGCPVKTAVWIVQRTMEEPDGEKELEGVAARYA